MELGTPATEKNNQRTPIEQRGSEPKGEKKPERRDPQPKGLRPRRSQSENKTRSTTRPTIGKEQDKSLESSSVLAPLESSSVLALFRVVGIKLQLDWKFLRDQCAAGIFGGSTNTPFKFASNHNQNGEKWTRPTPVEQRTERTKRGKKNQIYVVRSVMVETKLMVAFF